jgi:hypothetical protein
MCTYLVSRIALPPTRPKWASTWASSPRSSTRCHQNDFRSFGTLGAKPSTYLVLRLALSPNRPTLTLSPNGPKWDSTWPTSPSSFIVHVQNNFRAYGTFNANHAPILHRDKHYLQTDWNELSPEPHHLGGPSGVSKMISKPLYVWHKPCIYPASTQTMSPNGLNEISHDPHWSSIRCIQNDFSACDTFGANMHLSCVEISTTSKRTEMSFHMSLVT